MKKTRLAAALLSAVIFSGCAAPESSSSYLTDESPATTTTVSSSEASTDSEVSAADESGVYVVDGYAAKLNYPLDEKSVEYAAKRFGYVYEQYLKDNCDNIFVSVIPDKNYFLAEQNGYPSIDYSELTSRLVNKMDYAEYIDIYPLLELTDYYHTDTHWRQEKITDLAERIASAMGVAVSGEYTQTTLDVPFYGVHCRQSDISVEPDSLVYLENDVLSECRVFDMETNSYSAVYNLDLASGDDPYEIFLSGAKSLLTIENPNASTDRELVIFRDSFASSLAPLLAEGYAKITLVDIRYLMPELLGRFVEFHGQDILFLYSTLVINNSAIIK